MTISLLDTSPLRLSIVLLVLWPSLYSDGPSFCFVGPSFCSDGPSLYSAGSSNFFQQRSTPIVIYFLFFIYIPDPMTISFLFFAGSLASSSFDLASSPLHCSGFSVAVASCISLCSQDTLIHKRGPNIESKTAAC